MTPEINKVLEKAAEGGPWQVGDEEAFVLNDAVVVVRMVREGGKNTLKVECYCGKPTYLDLTLGLTTED